MLLLLLLLYHCYIINSEFWILCVCVWVHAFYPTDWISEQMNKEREKNETCQPSNQQPNCECNEWRGFHVKHCWDRLLSIKQFLYFKCHFHLTKSREPRTIYYKMEKIAFHFSCLEPNIITKFVVGNFIRWNKYKTKLFVFIISLQMKSSISISNSRYSLFIQHSACNAVEFVKTH